MTRTLTDPTYVVSLLGCIKANILLGSCPPNDQAHQAKYGIMKRFFAGFVLVYATVRLVWDRPEPLGDTNNRHMSNKMQAHLNPARLPKLSELANLQPSRDILANIPECSCWNWASNDKQEAEMKHPTTMDHKYEDVGYDNDDYYHGGDDDGEECCWRSIHRGHKMGYALVQGLVNFPNDSIYNTLDESYVPPQILNATRFFSRQESYLNRNVVVLRDYVDAVVSGYLYHKGGNECWLDPFGKHPKEKKHYLMDQFFDWESLLKSQAPYKDARYRSICEYLIDESEEDGMRVFVDLSIAFWYQKYFDFSAAVRSNQNPAHPRVKFVCFENLSSPLTQRETFHSVMDWLYPPLPGGGVYDGSVDPRPIQKEYSGGHSTKKDPELRRRLRDLVLKLDRELFGGILARESEATGCGARIYTPEQTVR